MNFLGNQWKFTEVSLKKILQTDDSRSGLGATLLREGNQAQMICVGAEYMLA